MNRLPAIFESSFIGFQLGTTPVTGLSHGHYLYLIIVVLVIATSFFSFKLNSGASMSEDQAKQMKMMTNFMTIFIGIASLTLSTGIIGKTETKRIFDLDFKINEVNAFAHKKKDI